MQGQTGCRQRARPESLPTGLGDVSMEAHVCLRLSETFGVITSPAPRWQEADDARLSLAGSWRHVPPSRGQQASDETRAPLGHVSRAYSTRLRRVYDASRVYDAITRDASRGLLPQAAGLLPQAAGLRQQACLLPQACCLQAAGSRPACLRQQARDAEAGRQVPGEVRRTSTPLEEGGLPNSSTGREGGGTSKPAARERAWTWRGAGEQVMLLVKVKELVTVKVLLEVKVLVKVFEEVLLFSLSSAPTTRTQTQTRPAARVWA